MAQKNIRDAINGANLGVTASIINDGSTGTPPTPYRLVLTANEAGTSKAITSSRNGSTQKPMAPRTMPRVQKPAKRCAACFRRLAVLSSSRRQAGSPASRPQAANSP